jgi:hypothetical protein
MTTKLTHEDAAYLELVRAKVMTWQEVNRIKHDSRHPCHRLVHTDTWHWIPKYYGLNDAGEAALARYNEKWRRVDAEALSALVEFVISAIAAADQDLAGYPAQLAQFDYLREAVAKAREALK